MSRRSALLQSSRLMGRICGWEPAEKQCGTMAPRVLAFRSGIVEFDTSSAKRASELKTQKSRRGAMIRNSSPLRMVQRTILS